MAKITQINNGDSGLVSRTNINEAMKTVEVDGTTITGDGTVANPLVSNGGAVDSVNTKTGVVVIDGTDVELVDGGGVTVTQAVSDLDSDKADLNGAALTSASINGVTPIDSGSGSSLYLDDAGNYTSPPSGGGGEINTSSTSGTGAALTLAKVGADLPFRGVKGVGAAITTDADSLTITAASAAQGAKADSAIQSGDLSAVATSGDYADLSNKPTTITTQQASDITANNAKISYTDAAQVSTNTSDISTIQGEQTTQDSAIALNTAKVSYTDAALVATHTTDISTLDSDKLDSVTTGEPTGSDVVGNAVSLTQAEYDAGTPVATTFYIIT